MKKIIKNLDFSEAAMLVKNLQAEIKTYKDEEFTKNNRSRNLLVKVKASRADKKAIRQNIAIDNQEDLINGFKVVFLKEIPQGEIWLL